MKLILRLLTVVVSILLMTETGVHAGIFDIFRIERGSVEVHKDDVHLETDFGYEDTKRIKRHYQDYHRHKHYKRRNKGNKKWKRGLPPGLAKKQQLPPGIQKQLAVGHELPSGLESEPLPPELEHRLKHLPDDYVRVKVWGLWLF